MCRFGHVALAFSLILAIVVSGCDGEASFRGRSVSYWIDASHSPNTQTKQQAIGALMTFNADPRAVSRLAEIRGETLAKRGENWTEFCRWLEDPSLTREHRAVITTYIGSMPESESGIMQYTSTVFPGKWEQTQQILLRRQEKTQGADRELYQSFMQLH